MIEQHGSIRPDDAVLRTTLAASASWYSATHRAQASLRTPTTVRDRGGCAALLKRRIAHDTWARWQALDIPGRATSFSKAVLPLLSLWSSCTPLASMARRNSGVRPCSTARTRRGRLRPTCSVTRSISNTASLDRPLRHVVRIHAESTSALRPFFRQLRRHIRKSRRAVHFWYGDAKQRHGLRMPRISGFGTAPPEATPRPVFLLPL